MGPDTRSVARPAGWCQRFADGRAGAMAGLGLDFLLPGLGDGACPAAPDTLATTARRHRARRYPDHLHGFCRPGLGIGTVSTAKPVPGLDRPELCGAGACGFLR